MRKAIPVVIILVVIAAVYFAFFRNKTNGDNSPEFTQINPERGYISQTVAASGGVTSNLDVEIKCKASGTIITLPFDISDTVREGELLLELDPVDEERNVDLAEVSLRESRARLSRSMESLDISERDLETSRDRAEVDLQTARARADETRARANRIEELYEGGFISEEEYEQALIELVAIDAEVQAANIRFDELASDEASLELLRQDVILASAAVESAQISLQSAMQRLEDTRVFAPMDGIVTERYVQSGQIISSGISSTTGGTPVMMISDLSRLFILARVDESNIGQVETGQRVEISVDAFSDEAFDGEVDRIAPMGVNVSNVVTFEVRIEVTSDNKDLLMPEMTADVEIVIGEADDAVMVPSNAVRIQDGTGIVMVLGEDGQPVTREVETGINNGEYVEVLSGLSETDVVLIGGMDEASMWRRPDDEDERRGPPPGMILRRPH